MMHKTRLFLLIIGFLFNSSWSYGETKTNSMNKNKSSSSSKNDSYFFQPLLIQGKKRLSEKAKDLKIEGESVVESEIFSIKMNFKERIFEMRNME